MSWESCVVLLNSDSTGNCYTGDIVTGTVVLEFTQKQHVQYLFLKVIGLSKAQWSRSMPTVPFIKNYSEKKVLLDIDVDIFNELEGKTILPGVSTFQFHFLLPPDLPSSFQSAIAKVYYYVIITGKASYKFKNHKIVPFKVRRMVNVNNMEEYLAPAFTEFIKKIWRSGEVRISFKTFTAIAPKQQAPFQITIHNEKHAKISKINVILLQKVKYVVDSGYADEEHRVCKVRHKNLSNTVIETCVFSMEIPETIPSTIFLDDAMVNISYVYRVEVIFGFHTTVFKDVPVVIATVPVLHYNFDNCL